MNTESPAELVRRVDEADRVGRAQRLSQLTDLLGSAAYEGFTGDAARWLFEDIKSTWIFGCFPSTIIAATAFCKIQLAGQLRMLPGDPALPGEPQSLEELAALAARFRIISTDSQALLVELHDRALAYEPGSLEEYNPMLERHMVEAQGLADGHPLIADGLIAVRAAIGCVYR